MAPLARRSTDELVDIIAAQCGWRFRDPALLREALAHASSLAGRGKGRPATRSHATRSNERLEFLGDRVLGLVIAHLLIRHHPDEPEGALSVRHDALVKREALAEVADELALGDFLVLARGEEEGGGRRNRAILADSCEALIGAIFLDGGLEPAERFIACHWTPRLEGMRTVPRDPKTTLQEWAQARGLERPVYQLVSSSGAAHAPVFEIDADLGMHGRARGKARSKRAAEQAAAGNLLASLQEEAARDG